MRCWPLGSLVEINSLLLRSGHLYSMQSPILFSLNWHPSGELAKEDLEQILILLAGGNELGSDDQKPRQIKVA